jgi:prevent-host-death family protein
MLWKIGQAKQRFSEVVRRAATEPQLICSRDRVVAAVIDADSAAKLEGVRERAGQRSVAHAFEDFRALAKRERYTLKTPRRKNRRPSSLTPMC